jgi:hypothetical protein
MSASSLSVVWTFVPLPFGRLRRTSLPPSNTSAWSNQSLVNDGAWLTALLKDADGLDRVRLGDLDPRYLRHEQARSMVGFAERLYAHTEGSLRPSPDYFARLWPAVLRLLSPAGDCRWRDGPITLTQRTCRVEPCCANVSVGWRPAGPPVGLEWSPSVGSAIVSLVLQWAT